MARTATRPYRITSAPRRRRRTRSRLAVSRVVTFGPALILPAWGWMRLHDPEHLAGLAVMMILGLWLIPAVIVLVIFLVPHSGPAMVRRKTRKRYRHWLTCHGIPRGQRRFWQLPNGLRYFLSARHWCEEDCVRPGRGMPREKQRSSRISPFLRRVTYAADRHRCCYTRDRLPDHLLNADHYCPWSQGGMTTLWNLMTLSRDANLVKSNYWPGTHYRPVEGSDNLALAIAVLAAERRRRHNPLVLIPRMTRAAWALGA
jgi:5-methylcytosine-specific restriction endonuclease McrA